MPSISSVCRLQTPSFGPRPYPGSQTNQAPWRQPENTSRCEKTKNEATQQKHTSRPLGSLA
eukprot:1044023-Prymnesium_polylepis.4